jgi:hypothetical protein
LALVHSEDYVENILTYIIEAESLSTRIFHVNKEMERAQLSQSMKTAAELRVPTATDGAAMQSQDLCGEPVDLTQAVNLLQGRQGSDTMSEAISMIASTLQMVAQQQGKQSQECVHDQSQECVHDHQADTYS